MRARSHLRWIAREEYRRNDDRWAGERMLSEIDARKLAARCGATTTLRTS
ncbi:MAG: hypothetical protein U5M23_08735 [Marinagarivorans sp.]|nr:hypothetical protein [Marinagarivorans sp.]